MGVSDDIRAKLSKKHGGVYEGIPERGYCGSIVVGLEV